MIRLETQYFNLNRILLLAIGLWPYQQSNFTRLQFIFLSTILTTSLIFQCTPFISQKCTLDFVAKILSSASFFVLFVIKYNMFGVNIKAVKDLLEQLQFICNELKDKNEFAIINEYGCSARRCTAALTNMKMELQSTFKIVVVNSNPSSKKIINNEKSTCNKQNIKMLKIFDKKQNFEKNLSAFIVAQFWSSILNNILSINVSQSHRFLIPMEYFVDQEKYFYWILLHYNVSFCIGITAMIGIGTTLLAYYQHTCGMFKITSYRIEHAMNSNMLQNINFKNELLIFEGLIWAVDIHRQAMKLTKHLQSSIQSMMFCIIVFGVAAISLNLYRIFQIIHADDTSLDNARELIFPVLYTTVGFLYMFLSNYIGQYVTDHNHNVFVTVYNVQWYIAPLHIQKMILFLLQRESRDFVLNVGFFVISIEFFATLVKTSVSYFTVMYSTQ